MPSKTITLTLEQVLEFVQNLPLEYKQAVKQKLEEEKGEENNQQETTNSVISDENEEKTIEQSKKSKVDEIAGLVHDPNAPDYKTLRNKAIVENYEEKLKRADEEEKEREQEKKKEADEIAERRAIVESLGGSLKVDLPEDFDYKKEYRNLIIKKYLQDSESEENSNSEPKKSLVSQIRGIAKDPHAPDYKTLRNKAIAQRYKERS